MAQKFCPNCGAQLGEEVNFCTQCGSVIALASQQAVDTPMENVQQPTAQQPTAQQSTAQQSTAQQPTAQQPTAHQPTYQQPYNQQPYNQQPYNQQPYNQQPYNQQPYNQQSYNQQPPQQPMGQQGGYYYPSNGYANPSPYGYQPVMMKPKIRGRGLGIASMVLGILALVFSLSLFSAATETIQEMEDKLDGVPSAYREQYQEVLLESQYEEDFEDGLTSVCIFTVLPILAVSFGFAAKSRGYRCGVSTSGLVMGFIALAASVASIVLVIIQLV